MVPAGVPRSAAISALVTVAFWVGGCSPAGLPLLPQDREVRTGRETADAAGSAARAVSSSEKQRALYESNLEQRQSSGDDSPEESTGSAATGSDEPETDEPESSESDTSGGVRDRRRPAAELRVVERDGDTYEFVSGEGDSTRPESTERRLLRAVVAALAERDTQKESKDHPTGDAGAPAAQGSGSTAPAVRLDRLVVDASDFELHGASTSREKLEAYLSRLREQRAVESVEIALPPAVGDTSDAEFQLSGTHSHD